jgi:hypothetical protein
MKRKLVTFGTAVLFLIAASFITSCGNSQNAENQEEHEQMDAEEHEAMDQDKMEMDENNKSEQTASVYVCPMHPEVKGNESDKCSKCGMPLEKVKTEEEDHSGHNHE